MSKKEEYCPLLDICNKYPNCSMFANYKWLKCIVYKRIRSWIYEKIEADDDGNLERKLEHYEKIHS